MTDHRPHEGILDHFPGLLALGKPPFQPCRFHVSPSMASLTILALISELPGSSRWLPAQTPLPCHSHLTPWLHIQTLPTGRHYEKELLWALSTDWFLFFLWLSFWFKSRDKGKCRTTLPEKLPSLGAVMSPPSWISRESQFCSVAKLITWIYRVTKQSYRVFYFNQTNPYTLAFYN